MNRPNSSADPGIASAPSPSRAGLAGILAAVGVSISPEIWREATAAATGLAGLAAVLLRECKR
jgi:hypothetical protein